MPKSPITADIHETLDIQGYLGPQAAFNLIIVLDKLPESIQLLNGKVIDEPLGIYLCFFTNLIRAGPANPKDIGQGNVYVFIGEVNPRDTRHTYS
jgi:hypothetical protein